MANSVRGWTSFRQLLRPVVLEMLPSCCRGSFFFFFFFFIILKPVLHSADFACEFAVASPLVRQNNPFPLLLQIAKCWNSRTSPVNAAWPSLGHRLAIAWPPLGLSQLVAAVKIGKIDRFAARVASRLRVRRWNLRHVEWA